MAVRFNVGDISRFRMDGEVMNVTAIARHPGVLNYRQSDGTVRGELVSPLFLRKLDSNNQPIIRKIAGVPITNEHPSSLLRYNPDSVDELTKGKVGQKLHVFKDGSTEVSFEVFDSALQDEIRSGRKPGVSLGYEVNAIPKRGNWDGIPYQYEQTDPFHADHLAVVAHPRAKGALISRFDAHDGDEWAVQISEDSQIWDRQKRQSLDSGTIQGAFAGTELSFPIASIRDVTDAWISSFRTDSEEEVRKNILTIAREYGWQDGLPPAAIAWAQERGYMPTKTAQAPKTSTKREKRMTMMTFDGGLQVEVPSEAAAPIAALRIKADGLEKELATLRADMKHMEEEMDKEKKDKAKMKGEMDALTDSVTTEKSRADAEEKLKNDALAALETEKANAPNMDADAISSEVNGRIAAYQDAIAILAPEAKASLDAVEINFDGSQDVLSIQKAVIAALSPDLKFDSDAEIPGAYKMLKIQAAQGNQTRSDSTFSIVKTAIGSTARSDADSIRLQRLAEQQKQSRLSLSQQRAGRAS